MNLVQKFKKNIKKSIKSMLNKIEPSSILVQFSSKYYEGKSTTKKTRFYN